MGWAREASGIGEQAPGRTATAHGRAALQRRSAAVSRAILYGTEFVVNPSGVGRDGSHTGTGRLLLRVGNGEGTGQDEGDGAELQPRHTASADCSCAAVGVDREEGSMLASPPLPSPEPVALETENTRTVHTAQIPPVPGQPGARTTPSRLHQFWTFGWAQDASLKILGYAIILLSPKMLVFFFFVKITQDVADRIEKTKRLKRIKWGHACCDQCIYSFQKTKQSYWTVFVTLGWRLWTKLRSDSWE